MIHTRQCSFGKWRLTFVHTPRSEVNLHLFACTVVFLEARMKACAMSDDLPSVDTLALDLQGIAEGPAGFVRVSAELTNERLIRMIEELSVALRATGNGVMIVATGPCTPPGPESALITRFCRTITCTRR